MNKLPQNTVRLITSTQAVSGVSSVVKELVENALDAGASIIEVKIDDYGLNKIEVKDNGSGVSIADIPYMAKKHYTSKIREHSDLMRLSTLGFRGEALGAIAAVAAELEVITKCSADKVGRSYKLDNKGDISSEANIPTSKGTSVIVHKLYKNLPVRRQYYSKRKKDELKSLSDLMVSYGVAHPCIRFLLKHDKSVIWQKAATTDLSESLSLVLTPQVRKHLSQYEVDFDQVKIVMYLPSPASLTQDSLFRSSGDRTFIYVKKRCVRDKQIEKVLKEYVCREKPGKFPVCYIDINVPAEDIDVNLEPDKTKVLIAQKEAIMDKLEALLKDVYGCKNVAGEDKSQLGPNTLSTTLDSNDSVNVSYNYVSPKKLDKASAVPKCQTEKENVDVDHRVTDIVTVDMRASPDKCNSPVKLGDDNSLQYAQASSDQLEEADENIRKTEYVSLVHKKTLTDNAEMDESDGNISEPVNSPSLYLHHLSSSDSDIFADKASLDEEDSISLFPVSSSDNNMHETSSCQGLMEKLPCGSSKKIQTDTNIIIDGGTEINNQPETSTQKSSAEPLIYPLPIEDSSEVFGATSCDLYNTESICQTSTPSRQTQLSQFFSSKEVQVTPKNVVNNTAAALPSDQERIAADKWVRGELIDDEPVVLAQPLPCKTHFTQNTLTNYTTPEPAAAATRKRKSSSPDLFADSDRDDEPVSMIREETIPDEYRQIVTQSNPPVKKHKGLLSPSDPSVKNSPLLSAFEKTRTKQSKSTRRSEIQKEVVFSVSDLQTQYKERLVISEFKSKSLAYCGSPRTTTGCIALLNDALYAFNPYRYEEMKLYKDYFESLQVPTEYLIKPIPVTKQDLSDDAWGTLTSLPLKDDPKFELCCPGLSMNGYSVSLVGDAYNLISVPKNLPGCGLEDLAELLEHINAQPVYRPKTVSHFIESEVVRIIRSKPPIRPLELEDLVKSSAVTDPNAFVCIHGKTVLTKLAHLVEDPLSD